MRRRLLRTTRKKQNANRQTTASKKHGIAERILQRGRRTRTHQRPATTHRPRDQAIQTKETDRGTRTDNAIQTTTNSRIHLQIPMGRRPHQRNPCTSRTNRVRKTTSYHLLALHQKLPSTRTTPPRTRQPHRVAIHGHDQRSRSTGSKTTAPMDENRTNAGRQKRTALPQIHRTTHTTSLRKMRNLLRQHSHKHHISHQTRCDSSGSSVRRTRGVPKPPRGASSHRQQQRKS